MSQSTRLGLLGRKVGMMRVFTDDGDSIPVTVIDVSNNRVTQVKTVENDGYVSLAGHIRFAPCIARYQANGWPPCESRR